MSTIVIGNIPPPVDGAGMVTARAVELMRDELGLDIELFDCFDEKRRVSRELANYARAAVRLMKPDVSSVYVQGVQGERMLLVLVLLVVAKVFKRRVLHHHHAYTFIDSPSLLWRMICSKRFSVTHIVLSENMGKQLEAVYGNSDWCSVSNAAFVRDEFSDTSEGLVADEPTILFAGAAGIGKGEDVLVEAVRRIRETTGQNMKVVLAGKGHSQTEAFVEVVGVLEPKDLAIRMSEATVLVLPSRYAPEAAPMVLYEAAACGLPSIASKRGCIAEMSVELDGEITLVEPDLDGLVESLIDHFGTPTRCDVSASFDRARSSGLDSLSELFSSKRNQVELDGVCIAQLVGAPYRSEVFGRASELGCRFVWGDEHFEPNITTPMEMSNLNPKPSKNVIFGGRKLAWQRRTLFPMLRAQTLVIEGNPRWLNTYVVASVRRALKRPTVFWGHFGHHGSAGTVRRSARRLYRNLPDRWMAYTESEAIEFRKLGLKAEAAPNPLPPCSDPGFSISGSGEALLFLGRLSAGKRLDELLRAIAKLDISRRLHVVGDGPLLPEMRALAIELGIQDQVDFHGHLPCGNKLHSIMELCSSVVIPSYVGLNLPQAMAHGLPGLIDPDQIHSPEIEVANLHPEMIRTHSGGADGLVSGMQKVNGVPEFLSVNVSDRYSTENWIAGLIASTVKVPGAVI